MLKRINITEKMTRAAGLTAGGVANSIIQGKLIPMVMKNADAKISNAISLAIGLLGPDLIRGKKAGKPGFIEAIGDGIVTVAGLNLAASLFPGVVGLGFLDPMEASGYLGAANSQPVYPNMYNAGLVAEASLTGMDYAGSGLENPGVPVTGTY